MSDQPEQPVRRVGRKDRKRSLDNRKPLIPEDDQFAPPELARADEEVEPTAPEPEPVVEAAPRVQTPSEARFPPLDPDVSYATSPKPAPQPTRKRPNWLYNLLTIFFILATFGAVAYFVLLWRDPYNALNPLPPYTPLPIIITTTPLPPTVTLIPTETAAPTATFTPAGVEVILPTAPSTFPYTLAELDITYAQSASGCDWSAIAGSVVDAQGAGVDDLTVRVRGEESGFTGQALSGSAPDFNPGGFEVKLADAPQLAPFVVQLFSAEDTPLSEEYLVVTSDQCEQNIVVVRFTQS